MDLDEEVLEFLATKPDSGSPDAPVGQRRTAIRAGSDRIFETFGELPPVVAHVTDHQVTYTGGAVRVRVYRPDDGTGLPVHLFVHGGGFWLSSVEESVVDATCRERCRGARCVVVSVDYRLAPEHPFPVPVEDCYAALLWTARNAASLGGDPGNISVGGVSAGATLAAALTLAARDRNGPPLALQVLEVPALDLTLDTMRASGVGDAYGITVQEMQLCVDQYLTGVDQARHPLVSPLHAPDLGGLPPAVILTAEFDPLRLDGETYAGRLREAGVTATHVRRAGAVHGAIILTRSWAPARAWREDVISALRSQHSPPYSSHHDAQHRSHDFQHRSQHDSQHGSRTANQPVRPSDDARPLPPVQGGR